GLTAAAEAEFTRLTWADVAQAVAAHPKIGQRALGAGREADWSRREQAGVEGAREALAEMNRAYEERFGQTFLIFASGKTASEILAAARERLANDEETERAVVREELRKIVRRRLEKLVDSRINDRTGHVGVSTHILDNARGEPARGVPVL